MSLKAMSRTLGLGCCGGKIAKEFLDLGYQGDAANGSEQDLKALGNVPKYHLRGFDGFGGHRDRGLDCLAQNEEFMNYIQNIKEKIIFIMFGGGGSTGSGCATILAELLLQEKDDNGKPEKIVCPVIALPSSDEAIVKHRNAYQAVQELQEIDGIGAAFFINNDASKDYDYINKTFAKMLDVFLTNDSYSQINNFDESERMEMLRDNGAMVLSLVGMGKEQSVMLEKLTKTGIFAPVESNKICENIGIIHAGNDSKDIESNMVISEVGKPKNVFEGYNGKSTLIAVSGLDYPVTHVSKLGELAKTAYDERQRSRQQTVQKLANLSFMEDEPKKCVEEKKKPSKLELLQKRMKK